MWISWEIIAWRYRLILADRGFIVKDTVGLYRAQLKIPAFIKGKQQLHPLELEAARGLAAVRIHVEGVIGLVRNKYTILQTTMPLSLCQGATKGQPTSLDKMVTVCCALCNICPSVVPTETTDSSCFLQCKTDIFNYSFLQSKKLVTFFQFWILWFDYILL